MPPLAMSLTSLYLPSGVVIRFERTLKATLPTMRFCRSVAAYRACGAEPLFGGRLEGLRDPAQAVALFGRIERARTFSGDHGLKTAHRGVEHLAGLLDVGGGFVPGEIGPQRGERAVLRAGEAGQRACSVDQRRGRVGVALLRRFFCPRRERVEQPAVDGVLIVELHLAGRLLAGGQRNGGVDLVARGDGSGGEKAAVLDDQLAIPADDAVAPLVALGREPPDGAEQRRDHQPENGALQTAARLASFFGH